MAELSTDHLLGIKYITPKDIELIFSIADNFKEVINLNISQMRLVKM